MTFKRKEYVRPPRTPLTLPPEGTQPRATMGATGFAGSVPKENVVRSKPLLRAYMRIPCQWGGCGNIHTACAHANWGEYGKAGARKADDIYGASLCWEHHSALDQGSRMSYDERKAGWIAAHEKTMAALIALSWEPGEHKLRALLQKVGVVKA